MPMKSLENNLIKINLLEIHILVIEIKCRNVKISFVNSIMIGLEAINGIKNYIKNVKDNLEKFPKNNFKKL